MEILFWGSVRYNSGPDNVNKGIVKNLTETFYWTNSKSSLFPSVNDVKHLIKSDVVVISGLSRDVYIMAILTKLFRKTLVYILHGYFAYESKVNESKKVGFGVMMERLILKMADLILPVSKKFMAWFHTMCPKYKYKTKYLYNGMEKDLLSRCVATSKIEGSIIATGGDRIVKCNDILAEVVESLYGDSKLEIYGCLKNTVNNQYTYVKYMGNVQHMQFMQKLAQTELFVLNSIYEPYCLAVVEALFCGCSILVSEVAGVTDLLTLEESDIIHDPMDRNEIKEKILYLQQHPNNKRIMAKLDIDEYSYAKQVQRLEKFCEDLLKKSV